MEALELQASASNTEFLPSSTTFVMIKASGRKIEIFSKAISLNLTWLHSTNISQKVSQLGVGSQKVTDLKEFNSENLEKRINECFEPTTQQKCQDIATKLQSENGVETGASMIETIYNLKRGTGKKFEWQPDSQAKKCNSCSVSFTLFNRRHHCRYCGLIFCLNCLAMRSIPNYPKEQMVCRECWDERSTVETDFEKNNMNWEELTTEKGDKYYWNKKSNKVTWSAEQYSLEKTRIKGPPKDSKVTWGEDKPEGEDWQEYATEKGEVYYYNPKTNLTTWTNKKLEQLVAKNPVLKKPPPPDPEEKEISQSQEIQTQQTEILDAVENLDDQLDDQLEGQPEISKQAESKQELETQQDQIQQEVEETFEQLEDQLEN